MVYWKNEGYATVRSLLKRHIEPVREAVHPPSVPSAKSSPSAELRIAVAVERVLLLRLATKFVHPDVAHPEVLEPDANRALDACVIAYRTAKLELDCLEKHFGAHETAAGKGEDTTVTLSSPHSTPTARSRPRASAVSSCGVPNASPSWAAPRSKTPAGA